jgi:hypothetical protein
MLVFTVPSSFLLLPLLRSGDSLRLSQLKLNVWLQLPELGPPSIESCPPFRKPLQLPSSELMTLVAVW